MASELDDLHAMLAKQLEAETAVTRAEADLKAAKAHLRLLQEDLVPSAFDNADLTKVENDLYEVKLKSDLTMRTLKDNKPKCVAWLRENEHGELIATTFSVPFGKNKDNEIGDFRGLLEEQEFGYSELTDFNTGSAKALIKKMLKAGTEVPLELFGAEQYRKAIIKIKDD